MTGAKIRTFKTSDDLWDKFGDKCREANTDRSTEIRRFMLAYVGGNETKQKNLPDNWLEERVKEIVREELPPTLKALKETIEIDVGNQIRQAKIDWMRAELNEPDNSESDLGIELEVAEDKEEAANSESLSDQFEGGEAEEEETEALEESNDFSSSTPTSPKSDPDKIEKSIEQPARTEENARELLTHSEMGRLVGHHRTTLLRWSQKWDRIDQKTLDKLNGYVPYGKSHWTKA